MKIEIVKYRNGNTSPYYAIMQSILIFILLLPLTVISQNNKSIWESAARPGTEKWNKLITEKDRINALQIPDFELEKLSAEEATISILNFPLFGYYSAFNTPQEGINIMFSKFNIFRRLCAKDSVGYLLISRYDDAGMGGWKKNENQLDGDFWTLKLNYIEYLIAQSEVLNNLDKEMRKHVVKAAKEKLNEKFNHSSFNSMSGISSTLFLIGRILDSDKKLPERLKENKNIQIFIESGTFLNIDNMDLVNDILNAADLYITE
jgi:hypothetical protein